MKISQACSRKIARISFSASLLIIYLHSSSEVLSKANDGSFTWWAQEVLSRGACRMAVPYFLVVFGMMLFKDWSGNDVLDWWRSKVAARFRSLFVPYLAWSLVGMLFCFVLSRITHNTEWKFNWSDIGWWLHVLGVGVGSVTEAPMYMFHLWFVRFIILAAVASPVIAFIVKRLGLIALVPFALMAFFTDIPYWASQGLFFVGFGCYLAIRRNDWVEMIPPKIWVVVFGVVWLSALWLKSYFMQRGFCDTYGTWHVYGVAFSPFVVVNSVGVLFVWFLYDALSLKEEFTPLDYVTGASFFVYCSHLLSSRLVVGTLKKLSITLPAALNYLMVLLVDLALCLAAFSFLKLMTPKVFTILTGGRVGGKR